MSELRGFVARCNVTGCPAPNVLVALESDQGDDDVEFYYLHHCRQHHPNLARRRRAGPYDRLRSTRDRRRARRSHRRRRPVLGR